MSIKIIQVLVAHFSIVISQYNHDKVHFADLFWQCNDVSQLIEVHSNDCYYFDQFVTLELLNVYNITQPQHSNTTNFISCIQSTNSVKRASDACHRINIASTTTTKTICGAFQHFLYYSYEWSTPSSITNRDSDIDLIIGSDSTGTNDMDNYLNYTNYSYNYGDYNYLTNLKLIHYTLLYNTTTLTASIDDAKTLKYRNVLSSLPSTSYKYDENTYSQTTGHILMTRKITFNLPTSLESYPKQISKIQKHLPQQCSEIMYLPSIEFQKNTYTILSFGSSAFSIENLQRNLTKAVMYFAKNENDTGTNYLCLNYSQLGINNQKYIFTFINVASQSISFSMEMRYSWYKIQNQYLFCEKPFSVVVDPTSIFLFIIYSIQLPNEYFDEKYKSFDVFLVNLSDIQTLLCIVISITLTSIFVSCGLSKYAAKRLNDVLTRDLYHNSNNRSSSDNVASHAETDRDHDSAVQQLKLNEQKSVLRLHKMISIYKHVLAHISIVSVYLYVEYVHQINFSQICSEDEVFRVGLVWFEHRIISTLTVILINQLWNLRMLAWKSDNYDTDDGNAMYNSSHLDTNTGAIIKHMACHEKCYHNTKHDIYCYKYLFQPGWLYLCAIYGGYMGGSGVFDALRTLPYGITNITSLVVPVLLGIWMKWQEMKFYQSFEDYFDLELKKIVIHVIKDVIMFSICFVVAFYTFGPYFDSMVIFLNENMLLYLPVFTIPLLLLAIFIIRPFIFLVPGCIMSHLVIIGWYYLMLFLFLLKKVAPNTHSSNGYTKLFSFSFALYVNGGVEPIWIGFNVLSIIFFFHVGTKELQKLTHSVLSIFLTLLDVSTDLNVLIQWFINGDYIWFGIQLFILIASQLIASIKLGNANQYHEHSQSQNKFTNTNVRINWFDRLMTLLGVGRAWMGCKAMGNYDLYGDDYSVLKIYEIGLESIPTMILQIYVALVIPFSDNYDPNQDSTITLLASIGITFISISYAVFRLFNKHVPKNQNKDQNSKMPVTASQVFNLVLSTAASNSANTTNPTHAEPSMNENINIEPDFMSASTSNKCEPTQSTCPHTPTTKARSNISSIDLISEQNLEIHCIDDNHDSNVHVPARGALTPDSSAIGNIESNKQVEPSRVSIGDDEVVIDSNDNKMGSTNIDLQVDMYSKWTKFVVYLFLLSDMYVRGWSTIFFLFLLRQCIYVYNILDDEEKTGLLGFTALIAVLSGVYFYLTCIFEYCMLEWIKLDKYKSVYQNQLSIRIQETFIAFFSSIVNLLVMFSLKKFERKNSFSRYV